ncbi:MAG: hypothetical protein OEZ43_08990 [Gammaproteobacteria bacterium]|nr:hypothetical protein [Gammaproteobacteria bacterium]
MKLLRLLVLGWCSLMVAGVVHAAKPVSPIQVFILPNAEPVAGASMELSIGVRSHVSLSRLTMTFKYPSGAVLTTGKAQQQLSLKAGEYVELPYSLQLPQTLSGQISVEIISDDGAGVSYAARDVLPLGRRTIRGYARGVEISPYVIRERNGTHLREYPLP